MTEMVIIAIAVLVAVGVGAIIVLHSHNNAASIITSVSSGKGWPGVPWPDPSAAPPTPPSTWPNLTTTAAADPAAPAPPKT